MLVQIFQTENMKIVDLILAVLAFFGTMAVLEKLQGRLPRDMGRAFAHDGKISAGKPRGAGILFVAVFALVVILFIKPDKEVLIYLGLIILAMITGFLDDSAKIPWGELKKGFLDFMIAFLTAITYITFHDNSIYLPVFELTLQIPVILLGILIVILVWVSINVTNCTDGVDGLSGSLTLVTLFSFMMLSSNILSNTKYFGFILAFQMVLLAYLWFNANPSHLLMGDAGSRAMGLMIAITALVSGSPIAYIPLGIVMILDGGLGLVKVFLLRFLKIRIMKNIKTPLHDQVRKNRGWSNTQTVFRFLIIQILICIIYFFMI